MMRLQRIGRKNEAHFKIVVIEKSKGAKSQKYVDIVGSYNPKLGNVQIDTEKAAQWIANGVQASDTVRNFLIDQKVMEGRKVNALPLKQPTKKKNAPEVEETPEPVAEPESVEETASAEEAPAEEAPAEEAPAEEAPAEEAVVENPTPESLEVASEETPEEAENVESDETEEEKAE